MKPSVSKRHQKQSAYMPIEMFQRAPALCREVADEWTTHGEINAVQDTPSSEFGPEFRAVAEIGNAIAFRRRQSMALEWWADFWTTGRQLFDFSGSLVTELGQTDVDDAPLSALRTPYKNFYLHFGRSTTSRVRDPFYATDPKHGECRLDGAYVLSSYSNEETGELGHLEIAFTTRHDDGTHGPHFEFFLPLDLEWAEGVSETRPVSVRDGIERGLEDCHRDAVHCDSDIRIRAIEIAKEMGLPVAGIGPLSNFSDSRKAVRDILGEGIRLVVNALFFLSAYPEEQIRRPDPAAPAALLSVLSCKTTPSSGRKSAEESLRRDGFQYVTIVRAPERTDGGLASGSHSGTGPTPHLRRGHWRHQRHGKGLSQVRMTWIRPCYVLGSGEMPEANAEVGHIYLAKSA